MYISGRRYYPHNPEGIVVFRPAQIKALEGIHTDRNPQGFLKLFLHELPGMGHYVSARTLGNFAVSRYEPSIRLSTSGMQQRGYTAYKALDLHVRHGHVGPEEGTPPCRCPLHGVKLEGIRIAGTHTFIEPQSLVDAMAAGPDGKPAISTIPVVSTPWEFNARTHGNRVRTDTLGASPSFAVLQAYVSAFVGTKSS
jgi:hypothetical protein